MCYVVIILLLWRPLGADQANVRMVRLLLYSPGLVLAMVMLTLGVRRRELMQTRRRGRGASCNYISV